MAQPPLYSRQYSFSAFQTQNPSSPLPAQQVDIELNAVRASLNAAIGNIGLIQRDDGRLANNSVAMESIQPAVRLLLGAGWTPRGAWAPNTAYVVGDVVSEAGSTYVCNTGHVSLTTFAASSALWTTLFTVTPPPSTSYPEPLAGNTGQFLVATATGASAWQTLVVPLASSTTTGLLPLAKGGTGAADAAAARAALSAASQAAVTTAQQTADNALTVANNRVAKAGDTLTGFLTLHADPTSALHAATKQYVDAFGVSASPGRIVAYTEFTASGTWTPNAATTRYAIWGIGGGGRGAWSPGSQTGIGGQSGVYGYGWFTGNPGPQAVTIGAGVVGTTLSAGAELATSPGGATTVGTLFRTRGGNSSDFLYTGFIIGNLTFGQLYANTATSFWGGANPVTNALDPAPDNSGGGGHVFNFNNGTIAARGSGSGMVRIWEYS